MDGLAVPAHGFKLLSGTGNRPLAEEIGRQLGIPLTKVTCNRFADGEIFVRIDENVRGNDVFIVQSTNAPAENMMELLLLIDAARRASAARITVVMPYYGYSRQDRKDQPRVAIGAKLVANMSEVVNVVSDVEGRDCILADDMIDTAGTVTEAARALKALGANDVYVCATHAVFSGPAIERLKAAPFTEVVVTDTINLAPERRFER